MGWKDIKKKRIYESSPEYLRKRRLRYKNNTNGCRDRIKEKAKEYDARFKVRLGPKHYSRYAENVGLKSKYGITIREKEWMRIRQHNKCLICKTEFYESSPHATYRPHVDHCHITGKIRGLLCKKCNLGLGYYIDSISNLASAARYLYKHRH